MLDEIRELYEYTYSLDAEGDLPQRIKSGTFTTTSKSSGTEKAEFSGMHRFLTVLARACIFEDYMHVEPEASLAAIAKLSMNRWLGKHRPEEEKLTDSLDNQQLQSWENWLPDYLWKVLLKGKIENLYEAGRNLGEDERAEIAVAVEALIHENSDEECVRIAEELVSQCAKYKLYNSPELTIRKILVTRAQLASRNFDQQKTGRGISDRNDFNKITYSGIIGEANNRGRLRRYYLACESPHFEMISGWSRKKDERIKGEDLILKMTAACLLEARYLQESGCWDQPIVTEDGRVRAITVNAVDVTNWSMYAKRIQYTDKRCEYTVIDGEGDRQEDKLFLPRSYDNRTKITINARWFNKCKWTLIDATEDDRELDRYLSEHPGCQYYSDNGSGKPLARSRKYSR